MGWGNIHVCKSLIGLRIEMLLHTTAFDQEIIEERRVAAKAILNQQHPRFLKLSPGKNKEASS